MKPLKVFLLAVATGALGAHSLTQFPSLEGKVGPPIKGQCLDGSSFDLAEAVKKGPVVVYFISTTCPVTEEATRFYSRLARAYQNATLVGVANDGKEGVSEWNKKHKVPFKIVLDPEYKVIEKYNVKAAPTTFLIDKNGLVLKTWYGYSLGYLQEANGMVARLLKVKTASVDFTGAPKQPVAG